MQIYVKFEGFPLNNALFGLVSYKALHNQTAFSDFTPPFRGVDIGTSQNSSQQLSNEKKGPWLFRLYRGLYYPVL